MLFHLAGWTLLSAFGAVIGSAILFISKEPVSCHVGDRAMVATWLGLLTLASALLGLSVITPLGPAAGFGLFAILAIVALSMRPVRLGLRQWLRYLTWPIVLGLGCLFVVAALNSARTVQAYDTGLYHYQFVRWLSQYGTVRGFALLQERFGVSSSWFALAAPFDFGPFQGRVSGLTGGLAIFLCLLHFALAAGRVLGHRANRADWFLIGGYALILPVCLAWAFEVSLSPDLPAWILTLLTGWLMLAGRDPEPGQSSPGISSHGAILPLILALGAFTVKLSAAPMVLIAALFYWFNATTKSAFRLVPVAAAMLISVPEFVANVVSSACPLYPNSLGCFDVPWGVGKAAAKQGAADITAWARWGGPVPAGATAWNWILPWFSHLDKLLLMLFCCLCLLGFVAVRGWRRDRSLVYVLALALLGTAFLFVTAPNPRFGAGYLALYPALFLASVSPDIGRLRLWRRRDPEPGMSSTLAYLLVAIAVLLSVQGEITELKLQRSMQSLLRTARMAEDYSLPHRFVLPPALPRFSGDVAPAKNRRSDTVGTLQLSADRYNGIDYRFTIGGDQCWGAPIPCLPAPLTGNIHLRNPARGLRDGFTRWADSR